MLEPETVSVSNPDQSDGVDSTLGDFHSRVRQASLDLIDGLAVEDTVAQSMPDTSPSKWHLAHTTWFFEQFVLGRDPAYRPFNTDWLYLFNSYYQSVGPMHARPQRGLLTRPTLAEVLAYRACVDECMGRLFEHGVDAELASLVILGLNHEQQHQELLLTDIKHLFSLNPLQPAYRERQPAEESSATPLEFINGREGIIEIGPVGDGFAFDCETPRHRTLLHGHALASRPVSNAEYAEFIREGGYRSPTLWMSEGWKTVCEQAWAHPLYWSDTLETEFTLAGVKPIDPHAPVSHVSFFEADAFARWAGMRLPTEAEWESAAQGLDAAKGNFIDSGLLHPLAASAGSGLQQMFGDVWEWTGSPYVSYPGYRAPGGALGEYNGKFMCGQYVLRGGSCVTPRGHVRASYRNFFTPADRWQFMGLRLGKDR
ncbi:MAG TPA: ergothioneine biosynthesis protein EgtB [Dokdonella sp.]|uniref:ergothioneine biosynthesis protein EgtB n=1 Tax=Dokdonella sp. TaxID=2291710 RepID=UPI002D7EAA14|nr:ergothioneine biosynthesis protein EgtB [Dokdonella sp.]HET9033167.1 ergothioneine biosynthesis protein EgtB [Dokdonella sp.]